MRRIILAPPVPIDLLTVGEAFEDLIFAGLPRLPRRGEEMRTTQFVSTMGGGAVITAVAAARLGVRTAIVSGLSRDAERALRRERIDVANLRKASEPHAVTVALSTVRDRSFVTFDGVNGRLQARLPAALAHRRADHVHFAFPPVHCATWSAILERLRARGTTTSWDFGWDAGLRSRRGFARLLRTLDFVFVNELEAAMYAGAASAARSLPFWRRTARNTIVKLGARGSRWIGPATDVRASAPRVRVVDTTGAGDAFNAGFLSAFLRSAPPLECLRAGNLAGARSTRAAGGVAAV